jgi:hypothetical protein
LTEGAPIRSEPLLDEMAACKLAANATRDLENFGALTGKIKRGEHDDRVIAYGIALMIRDDAWQKGEIKPKPRLVADLADAYWQQQEEEERLRAVQVDHFLPPEALWDGN